ncbi:hypothetical protein [Glaciihabitans arcticus]|uniref:hypothetical protein n=1 Tax=Glaciihabitans arcticus TaxID=2668039 RepID=UPI001958C3D9|nr:hypothetical protein [Glaciihabitans arcticus]
MSIGWMDSDGANTTGSRRCGAKNTPTTNWWNCVVRKIVVGTVLASTICSAASFAT